MVEGDVLYVAEGDSLGAKNQPTEIQRADRNQSVYQIS